MARAFESDLGIVPALDIDSSDQLDMVVKATTNLEGVVGYKLGLTTVLRLGLAAAVEHLRTMTDLPILYDHQKAGPDMPDMAKKFTGVCRDAAVDGLILFPVAGPTAVDGFVGEAVKAGLIPVVGGEIPVPDYGVSGGGYLTDDALDRILARAVKSGATHFVLPANNKEKIARWSGWISKEVANPGVFLTGFGALGGSIGEAFNAARACSRRYAIVGRLITGALRPDEAAYKMFKEMQAVG
jgi:orotidine-5'-phosphate decarboxylase